MMGKSLFLIVGGIACVGVAAYFAFHRVGEASGDGWREYKYPDEGYAISAPAKPITAPTSEEDPDARGYTINYGNRTVVMFGTSPYAMWTDISSPAEKLQRIEEMTVKGTSSNLVSKKELSLGGNPGIELEVESLGSHSRSRWYFVGGKVLMLYSTAATDAPLAPDTDRIFDSLRLLDNGK